MTKSSEPERTKGAYDHPHFYTVCKTSAQGKEIQAGKTEFTGLNQRERSGDFTPEAQS